MNSLIASTIEEYVQMHVAAMPKMHMSICKILVVVDKGVFLVTKRHTDGNAKPTRQPPSDPPTPRIGLMFGKNTPRRKYYGIRKAQGYYCRTARS